ncbi:MAG TPA: response regulator transcription factor [Pyrinomonadaceae bacterium]|nr:response regulator transcription factor [Pyrinomonadaceae bacterium]
MLNVENSDRSIRIVVADDNTQVREKVVQLLLPDCDVVGTHANGQSALEAVLVLNPDIALLDISMPIMSGIEVAHELRTRESQTKVVFLTVHEDVDFVNAAFDAGASAYVVKSQMASDLHAAISAVERGGVFVSPMCAIADELRTGTQN